MTRDEVIDLLRKYRRNAAVVFRGKVTLVFSFDQKAILYEISDSSGFYDKSIIYEKINYKKLGIEELEIYVRHLQQVDLWIENVLKLLEAATLFYLYIDKPRWNYYELSQKWGVSRKVIKHLENCAIYSILQYESTKYLLTKEQKNGKILYDG